jgi:hypothetical protein
MTTTDVWPARVSYSRVVFRFPLPLVFVPLLVATGVALGGCADETFVAARAPARPPARARVTIVGATIGPVTVDGARWDGLGGAPPTVAAGIARGMGADLGTEIVVAGVVADVLATFERPDPHGWAELGGTRVTLDADGQNTLTPSWRGSPSFRGVEITEATRLRVHLADDDLGSDQPIGDVEIGERELLAALDAQAVRQVSVAAQTHGQLLYVAIAVAPE